MKTNTKSTSVTTHEGGKAQEVSPYLSLRRSVMNCLLGEDEFYESGQTIKDRIVELCKLVEPEKIAALAVEAREKMKLRHAPLWLARCLLDHRAFSGRAACIGAVVKRPDEAGELLSLYLGGSDKRKSTLKIPSALKRGLAIAFREWDEYQLGKWQKESAGITVRDAMFICHAKPKEPTRLYNRVARKAGLLPGTESGRLFKALAENTLPTPDTWEVALSAGANKKEAWERLLREKKLPGMATLMNLRNMLAVNVDKTLIRERLKAGIPMALPFRFLTAARYAPALEPELDQAMLMALTETPKIDGATVVLVDISGSMDQQLSAKGETTRMDAACGVAIHVREKCSEVEVFTFSDACVAVPARRGMALRDAIMISQGHGSTQLAQALRTIKAKIPSLHRLIVITDEQSHDGNVACWAKNGYVINVASAQHGLSYGNGWQHIDGWSERVIDWIYEHERGSDEV